MAEPSRQAIRDRGYRLTGDDLADLPEASFPGLLRRLRLSAGLTQEDLAEAAGVSVRAVSDLERGVNHAARKDTARLLADALCLSGPARIEFEAAARGRAGARLAVTSAGRSGAGEGTAATRTLPRDIASFAGREQELLRLVDAAEGSGGVVGIYAIGGMAGIGRTAFAVHAAHLLADWFPDGQVFLPLHGHAPGRRPAEPSSALASLLGAIGVAVQHIPSDVDGRARMWRDRMAGRRVLVLLDDAAGS